MSCLGAGRDGERERMAWGVAGPVVASVVVVAAIWVGGVEGVVPVLGVPDTHAFV